MKDKTSAYDLSKRFSVRESVTREEWKALIKRISRLEQRIQLIDLKRE